MTARCYRFVISSVFSSNPSVVSAKSAGFHKILSIVSTRIRAHLGHNLGQDKQVNLEKSLLLFYRFFVPFLLCYFCLFRYTLADLFYASSCPVARRQGDFPVSGKRRNGNIGMRSEPFDHGDIARSASSNSVKIIGCNILFPYHCDTDPCTCHSSVQVLS